MTLCSQLNTSRCPDKAIIHGPNVHMEIGIPRRKNVDDGDESKTRLLPPTRWQEENELWIFRVVLHCIFPYPDYTGHGRSPAGATSPFKKRKWLIDVDAACHGPSHQLVFELSLVFNGLSNRYPSPVFDNRINQECGVTVKVDGYVYLSTVDLRYQRYAVIDRNLATGLLQRPDGIKAFEINETLQ